MQQQNTSGQQPPVMNEPPRVITTKDALYLKDHMSWHLMTMKKCAHYAQECTDPEIRQALDQAGRMHQKHYQMLLKHCQNNNTAEMAKVPQPKPGQQQQQGQQQNQQNQQQMQ
ncbi:hypothetical protein [Caldalkalibacillus salinus]|uniref:hypothetical protein n=1 Tax=Caldalkalibacillus salinus TaxID=2803787 RepID=UPI0019224844|nr:hypothetical protein [Caldalkalibacillus salinus]